MAKGILRVLVDATACASHEACNFVPEVFAFNGGYHPVVTSDAPQHFEDKRDDIIAAVLSCPVSALSLEYEDGRVITSRDYEAAGGVRKWQNY